MVNAAEVSTHVLEIAQELADSGLWASPELVLSVLLDRYSIHDFDSLCVGALTDVASLRHLLEVNSKICTYVDTFLATETTTTTALDVSGPCFGLVGSGIACLSDCQRGLEGMLYSLAVPALKSLAPSSSSSSGSGGTAPSSGEGVNVGGPDGMAAASDGNEVDIDDAAGTEAGAVMCPDGASDAQDQKRQKLSEGTPAPAVATTTTAAATVTGKPRRLVDYGLGPLSKHPRVTQIFGPVEEEEEEAQGQRDEEVDGKDGKDGQASSSLLSKSQVLSLLLHFQRSGGGDSDGGSDSDSECISKLGEFSAAAFDQFVLSQRGATLQSAGVRLFPRGDGMVVLGRDCAMVCRHVQMHYNAELMQLHRSSSAQLQLRALMEMQRQIQTQEQKAGSSSSQSSSDKVTVEMGNHSDLSVAAPAPAPSVTLPPPVPVLAIPTQASSAKFFQAFIREIGGNTYPPSFAKASAAVRKVSERNGKNGGKGESIGVDHSQLLTEYVMLHVGASKYRRGKLTYKNDNDDGGSSSNTAPAPAAASTSMKRSASAVQPPAPLVPQIRGSDLTGCDLPAFQHEVDKSVYTTSTSTSNRDADFIPCSALKDLCLSTPWRAANNYNGNSSYSGNSINIKDVGRWGEALIYQYLLVQYPTAAVTWVNKDAESMACYDLKIEQPMQSSTGRHIITTFVEVKASRFDNLKSFDISLNEWEFASGTPKVHYDIYRVFNAGDPTRVHVQVIRDVHESVKCRKSRLCLTI